MMTRQEAFDTIVAAYNSPDTSITEAITVIQLDAVKTGFAKGYHAGGLALCTLCFFAGAGILGWIKLLLALIEGE